MDLCLCWQGQHGSLAFVAEVWDLPFAWELKAFWRMRGLISWQERELVQSLALSGTDLVSLGQILGELSHQTAVPEHAVAYGCGPEQLRAAGMNSHQERHHGDQGDGKHALARGD